MHEDDLPEADPRRKTMPAGHALIALFVALVTAAFLNAQGMHKTALSQKPGITRDIASAMAAGLAGVSGFIQTDEPRALFKAALGRGDDDHVSTRVAFAGTSKAAVSKPVAKPLFSPTHKLRLYLTGDSLITDPGPVVLDRISTNASIKPVASTDMHAATGLVQPEVFNWFEYLPKQIASYKPDITVATFGANDGLGFTGVAGAENFGSPAWLAEYRRRVSGVMDQLTAKSGRVVWLGLPIPREPGLAGRWQQMNLIQQTEAAKRPGRVEFVDLYDRFKDQNGLYADYLPDGTGQDQQVRSSDGIHYEAAGAGIVATAIIEAIGKLVRFGVPVTK